MKSSYDAKLDNKLDDKSPQLRCQRIRGRFISPVLRSTTLGSLTIALSGLTVVVPIERSSLSEVGIDALRLQQPPYNLTGRKIAIGQVEIGRPPQFGFDKPWFYQLQPKARSPQTRLQKISVRPEGQFFQIHPTDTFVRDRSPQPNQYLTSHAAEVASVMVGGSKAVPGIAPNARLYAVAIGTEGNTTQDAAKRDGKALSQDCLATQNIALQNSGDVRVINYSFGASLQQDPRPQAQLDGNSLLTQCVDWSARVHQVLYVIAGNQGIGSTPIPTDHYNGMTIAYTRQWNQQYAKVDYFNIGDSDPMILKRIAGLETNVGNRRAIALVAPGDRISVQRLTGEVGYESGTSLAAPHVTGVVALLQEYGDRQLRQVCQRKLGCKLPWTPDARRPEVMKAVLMNAADKLKDVGDGLRLGMTRTIVQKNNQTWLEADVAKDSTVPLHFQMGTGQLNALRSVQQFASGQQRSRGNAAGQGVDPIAWDFNQVTHRQFKDYYLDRPLQLDSYVAITLVWQRKVELKDRNQNQQFDLGETFRDRGLNDLNLYLMPAQENDIRKAIAVSDSNLDSVEHIFKTIPKSGRYKIRVVFQQRSHESVQNYALAWWTKPDLEMR
jgi:Subtilase family